MNGKVLRASCSHCFGACPGISISHSGPKRGLAAQAIRGAAGQGSGTEARRGRKKRRPGRRVQFYRRRPAPAAARRVSKALSVHQAGTLSGQCDRGVQQVRHRSARRTNSGRRHRHLRRRGAHAIRKRDSSIPISRPAAKEFPKTSWTRKDFGPPIIISFWLSVSTRSISSRRRRPRATRSCSIQNGKGASLSIRRIRIYSARSCSIGARRKR